MRGAYTLQVVVTVKQTKTINYDVAILGLGGVTVIYSDFTPLYTKNRIKQQNNKRRLLYTRCYPKSKRLVNTSLGVVSLESDNSDKNKQGTFTAHRPIFVVAINLSNSPFYSFHFKAHSISEQIFYFLPAVCAMH